MEESIPRLPRSAGQRHASGRLAIKALAALFATLVLVAAGATESVRAQDVSPTPDPTVTALPKQKLQQEINKLQLETRRTLRDWLWTNGTVILALLLATGGVIRLFASSGKKPGSARSSGLRTLRKVWAGSMRLPESRQL